jgi:ribosomal protein S6
METEGREPQVYEVGYVLVPSVSPEKAGETVSALKAHIEKEGGSLISEDAPKQIRLAYTMVQHVAGKNYKHDTGYFGWVKFQVMPQVAVEIKKMLDKDGQYLRVLLVKTVSESTLYGQRIAAARAAATARAEDTVRREAAKKEVAGAGPVSEAEVDKAIEELVAE